MTQRISLTTLALIASIGCSEIKDNTLAEAYDSQTINFTAQATKAISNSVATMESDASGFVVYGTESGGTDWYDNLNGNSYIYNSTTQLWEWESSKYPSWPDPFNQMNFYAYYPTSATGFAPSVAAPSSIVGDIVVESSILDQTDYLAACSGDVVTKPLTGMQPLNFVHIMSKISFSVIQDEGILTIIRQLGIENIINQGSYDYVNSAWYDLSNNNLGSFDNYVGSSGPFAKYGVEDQVDPIRIDGHDLMLIPQSGGTSSDQTPLWDGSITIGDSGELEPVGAYISIRYRISASNDTEDIIGYAFRDSSPNETEWGDSSYFYPIYKKSGGTYTGPLYIKVGFKLSAEQLNWVAGSEYDYTLQLNKAGGIYLSEYYCDVDGTNTKIKINGAPSVGDTVFSEDINIGVTVNGWNYSESEIYPI